MESAGATSVATCFVVVRGISDYANSHKNDVWQRVAAATAAACAKVGCGIYRARSSGF